MHNDDRAIRQLGKYIVIVYTTRHDSCHSSTQFMFRGDLFFQSPLKLLGLVW
jgi:hypothetical protein